MNINPVNSFYNCSFGTNKRFCKGKPNQFEDEGLYQTTYVCRNDLAWGDFVFYLSKHFKDKPQVNVYSAACSDGTEPYSFVMMVKECLPEQYHQKFFPVNASDVDNYIIESVAKTGMLNLMYQDKLSMQSNLINMKKYFTRAEQNMRIDNDYFVGVSKTFNVAGSLKDNVEFKCDDIMSVLSNIKDEGNTVFMCRNVLMYLEENEIEQIIKTASEKLKKGSIFVTGRHDDMYSNTSSYLYEYGFKEIMNNVHVKM